MTPEGCEQEKAEKAASEFAARQSRAQVRKSVVEAVPETVDVTSAPEPPLPQAKDLTNMSASPAHAETRK